MHIPDGMLPAQVSAVGYAIAAPLLGYSLRKINRLSDHQPIRVTRSIPKAALLTATFFVASSIPLPLPSPVPVHFLMNGLLGAMLGYYAIPAIVIGLLFQALLLGHGGLTTLGINTLLLGIPALLAYSVFQLRHRFLIRLPSTRHLSLYGLLGGFAGGIGVIGSALLFFGIVILTIPANLDAATEKVAIYGLTLLHLPLALVEGVFTASFVVFLQRTKPELLHTDWERSPVSQSVQKEVERV
ncbi:MAG: cobalt transporter CbiM [Merismopedia sp. SIO2A8]|nr:cobalt transporter CbiM [Symploca sp. SIO2B6]NET47398.1 cobalt transporter CbiM [Merismopedia sp. SIO2A8]